MKNFNPFVGTTLRLLVVGVLVFLGWHFGVFQEYVDPENKVLMGALAVMGLHFAYYALYKNFSLSRFISREKQAADFASQQLAGKVTLTALVGLLKGDAFKQGRDGLDKSEVAVTFRRLNAQKANLYDAPASEAAYGDSLADRLMKRLEAMRQSANMQVKLGFIGTLVGFVLMLTGFAGDASTQLSEISTALPLLLGAMGNIGVAVMTTLAGVLANAYLMAGFNELRVRHAHAVASQVQDLLEVSVMPIINTPETVRQIAKPLGWRSSADTVAEFEGEIEALEAGNREKV